MGLSFTRLSELGSGKEGELAMNMQKIVAELDDVVSSVEMKWTLGARMPEHPEAKHFIGYGYGWGINVIDYNGTVDGGAVHTLRCIAVHLTPALARKALQAAKGAVLE